MRALLGLMAVAVPLLILAAPAALAQKSDPIAVGQTFPDQATSVGGWQLASGGMYRARKTANFVTTEVHTCCYVVLVRGETYTIARTEAAETTPQGGAAVHRVLETKVVTKAPYEEVAECGPLWIEPALSFRDKRSKSVRSFVVTDDSYALISWNDLENTCQYDG